MAAIGKEVEVNGHRGVVKFIGPTQFAEGTWYGIELDEPVGRNDGSVQNRKYFELDKNGLYGIFAKLQSIKLVNTSDPNPLQLEVSRLLQENKQLRRQLQKAESEGPNKVIDFLTIQNSDLIKSIESLQDELVQFQQKEDTHVKLQGLYVEVEKELRDQLEELDITHQEEIELLKEENGRLIQQLTERNSSHLEVSDLKSKLKIMEQQVYENKFLNGLYEVASNNQKSKEEFQFEYLSKWILDDRIRNSFIEKQKCKFIFIVLSGIAATLKDENMKGSFFHNLGNVSNWIASFLECLIPREKIQFMSVNNFLDSDSALNSNYFLAIRCMELTFGEIVPELLAFYKENPSWKSSLESISELYSVCLCIQKKCQILLNELSDTEQFFHYKGHLFVKDFLNIIFQELFGQFESNFREDHVLELTRNILEQIGKIEVQRQLEATKNDSESNDIQADRNSSTTMESKGDAAKRWQALFHKKEAELKELVIKNQVYQQRLGESNINELEFGSMKVEIGHLQQRNEQLIQEATGLEKNVEKLQTKLQREKLKSYQLFSNEVSEDLISELINFEKLDLISEIRDLRQLVSKHTANENKKSMDLSWLDNNTSRNPKGLKDISPSNRIHSLGNEVLELANYSTTINLQENKFKKNYMENTKFKISVIDSTIKDARLN